MEEAVDCDGDDEADDGEAHDDVVEPGVLKRVLNNILISHYVNFSFLGFGGMQARTIRLPFSSEPVCRKKNYKELVLYTHTGCLKKTPVTGKMAIIPIWKVLGEKVG